MKRTKAKPFLKWAGGKSQLLNQFQDYYPGALYKGTIKKYVEPFIGGGAVFFEMMQNFDIATAYISDINNDLILTYKVIRKNPETLCDLLEQYQNEYDNTAPEKRNSLFLTVRKHFNYQRFEINYKKFSENWIPRAAQLIFLNKTCFNGLFRLNSKGEFNVPYGKYPKPKILDSQNIFAVSEVLQNVEIQNASYTQSYPAITSSSFVYFDPPYKPISKTSGFTSYSGTEFSDKQQIELAAFYDKVHTEKQAKLMLSNSDPKNKNPDDNFFENTFANYNLYRVYAARAINSNGQKRGKIKEILITNYNHE